MAAQFDDDDETLPAAVNLGPLTGFPGYLFRRAQLKVYQGLYPVLAPYGIRPTQFGVMLLLKYNPGIKPSDVAATLGLQRTNFAPLLLELRQRGFAESSSGAEDKRTRTLFLTAKGLATLEQLERAAGAYEARIAAAIDPQNSGTLQSIAEWLARAAE